MRVRRVLRSPTTRGLGATLGPRESEKECLNEVNRQPSNGLKFNSQSSKRLFFTVNRQKCRLILHIQGISNLTFSADLHRILAPEETLNWKNQFLCSQKHFS